MSPLARPDRLLISRATSTAARIEDRAAQVAREVTAEMLLAMGQPVEGDGDQEVGILAAMRHLRALAVEGRVLEAQLVEAARHAGASWSEIGDVLGVTKQTAHQRYGHGRANKAAEDHTIPLW